MLLFFWWVLFERLPSLRGWDLTQVVALYGVMATGFGLATVVCGNATRLAWIVASGDLDYYLALPADPLVHLLVSRMSLPAWGDALFGLLAFLAIAPGRWAQLPLFLLLSLITAAIFVAFAVLTGSLAFWLGTAQNLAMQLNNALLTFGLYPVDVFPPLVRALLYTLIPAAFVGSIPVGLLTDFCWARLAGLVAFATALLLVARLVFAWGLRRYESGNLVRVRG
jgi:ABC-2 type transport system permease protein